MASAPSVIRAELKRRLEELDARRACKKKRFADQILECQINCLTARIPGCSVSVINGEIREIMFGQRMEG